MEKKLLREVFIVDGARSPFLKARGKPGKFSASDLAVDAGRELLARQKFAPDAFDEVIFGCVMPTPDETNIGRIIGLRLGCGKSTPGWTVQRNCASGMQSIDSAYKDIAIGRADLVLAGGTDAMSHAPLLFNQPMTNWFASMMAAKNFTAKLKTLTQFRLGYLKPVIALIRGLTDPVVGLNMGETAEELAYRFNITRLEMDEFSLRSHLRLDKAFQAGYMNDEVVTLYDHSGKFYQIDDGLRADSTMESLAKLKPFFDRKFGRVTAANSSQVTDGAAMVVLASETAVKKYNLPVLAKIIDINWAALDPTVMGLGPVFASTPLLQRNNLTLSDIDYWEINEAFAAQVLACLKAWEQKEFCREHLGLQEAFGKLDQSRLNIDGGAVAQGHPVGASGARITLHLAHILQRTQAKRGVATICIGGGQGGAILIERV